MTTPRDDIAGLIERMKVLAPDDGDMPGTHKAMIEAATQLAALSARVKELERDAEAFNRHEQTLRDNGIASHSEAVVRVVDAEARALRAEQERDNYERLYNNETVERLRAQQERDKAVDLLRKMTDHSIDDALYPFADCFDSASDFIRRLASGPEKEGK